MTRLIFNVGRCNRLHLASVRGFDPGYITRCSISLTRCKKHANRCSFSYVSSSNKDGYSPRELHRAAEILKRREVLDEYLKKILTSRVYDVADETQLQYARSLSKRTKNNVFLKREDTQPVFSFKIRGAYNKIANLTQEERDNGIVACSAGNHAQGVAMSAIALGIDKCSIVMPLGTPGIKVNSVRQIGIEPILHGENYDEAAAEAKRLRMKKDTRWCTPSTIQM